MFLQILFFKKIVENNLREKSYIRYIANSVKQNYKKKGVHKNIGNSGYSENVTSLSLNTTFIINTKYTLKHRKHKQHNDQNLAMRTASPSTCPSIASNNFSLVTCTTCQPIQFLFSTDNLKKL